MTIDACTAHGVKQTGVKIALLCECSVDEAIDVGGVALQRVQRAQMGRCGNNDGC